MSQVQVSLETVAHITSQYFDGFVSYDTVKRLVDGIHVDCMSIISDPSIHFIRYATWIPQQSSWELLRTANTFFEIRRTMMKSVSQIDSLIDAICNISGDLTYETVHNLISCICKFADEAYDSRIFNKTILYNEVYNRSPDRYEMLLYEASSYYSTLPLMMRYASIPVTVLSLQVVPKTILGSLVSYPSVNEDVGRTIVLASFTSPVTASTIFRCASRKLICDILRHMMEINQYEYIPLIDFDQLHSAVRYCKLTVNEFVKAYIEGRENLSTDVSILRSISSYRNYQHDEIYLNLRNTIILSRFTYIRSDVCLSVVEYIRVSGNSSS